MSEPIDERVIFAATLAAEFAHGRRVLMAILGKPLDEQQLARVMHEAVTAARGAIQGLRALGDGARMF